MRPDLHRMPARLPQQIKHYCYNGRTHTHMHIHTNLITYVFSWHICTLMSVCTCSHKLSVMQMHFLPTYMKRSQSQCQFRFSCRVLSVIGCEIYSSKVRNYVEPTLVLLLLNKLSSSNGWQKQERKLQLQQVDEAIHLLFIRKSSLTLNLPVVYV